jgi:two-component system capsular synthesis sensor histidine kinase RcsC
MPVDLSTSDPPKRGPQDEDTVSQAPVPDDRPASEAREGRGALAGVPILVVDDDPPGARLVRLLLSGAGAHVRTAYSGEEALDLLREFRARLILVDLVLPGMNGFVLARCLKAAFPDVVAVAMSVVHGAETERHALESGCVALIHKPIDVNSFAQTVARHLDRAA